MNIDGSIRSKRYPNHRVALIGGIILVLLIALFPSLPGQSVFNRGNLSGAALAQGQSALVGYSEWTQEGHDAQHTGFIAVEPAEPWTLKWTFNGSDGNGSSSSHSYDAPVNARTVTGGSFVYAPAGGSGLYALSKSNGSVGWHLTATSFNATPAYDPATNTLYAGGADGNLYKINATSGAVVATYAAGSPLNRSTLLVGGYAYAVGDNGQLHKVSISSMVRAWMYAAGSNAVTPPAYSPSRGALVYATADLYVHAVNDSNGTQKWRVKPSSHTASATYTFNGYWPVIAEQHGIVFLRMNLGMDALWSGPNTGPYGGGVYPSSNAETRSLLQANNGDLENLFALNLDNGNQSFVPAVGFGGVEDLDGGGNPILQNGPMPVVKVNDDGSEVAYISFRSGQGNPNDGRWDSHMGEMVLDSSTVSGLAAGDMRFVDFPNSYISITDEQTPFSMAGNTIFHAHWGASDSMQITNRSSSLGLTHDNPITATGHPAVIRRMTTCGDFNATTHTTSCGLSLYDDGRYWDGPGFWEYWNTYDPPTPSRSAYSEGLLPRYTYASDGMIIVEGNGGELYVFSHSGWDPQAPPGPGPISSRIYLPTISNLVAQAVPPAPTQPPASGGNLALNRPVTASSEENWDFTAVKSVDGDSNTRWGSQFSDPQWLQVDLGAVYQINQVVLNWEDSHGKAYKIQVSNDGNTWSDIYSTTNSPGGVENLTVSGSGRYVRMYGTQRSNPTYGYSLWEMEVYGSGGGNPAPTPTPPPSNGRISNMQVLTDNVARYDKFEVQFDVQTTASDTSLPYDPNPPPGLNSSMGVTVNALFSNDGWQTSFTQPGFLYQGYTKSVISGKDHYIPSGGPHWRVRFAPEQAGAWQFRLFMQDASGPSYYPDSGQPGISFNVGATSSNPYKQHGFIHVSQTDSRYFSFDDGTPFVGVGYNDGFSDADSVEAKMQSYEQNKMNFMRVWMSGAGINGSQWSSWASNFLNQDGYLPGTNFDINNTYNGSDVSLRLDDSNPCFYSDFWQGGVPAEPNTTYHVWARVKLSGVSGDFVIKQGDWLDQSCKDSGTGTRITNPVSGSTDWIEVNGDYTTSSSQSWLNYLYLARENAGGQVYIDEVRVWKASDPNQVNLLREPNANSHMYFDPMSSAEWDDYIT